MIIDEAYNRATGTFNDQPNGTAIITYDNAPNPYFYTLDAAGLIDAMNLIDVSFSLNALPEELVKFRNLFPNNNPSRIVGINEEGDTTAVVDISYNYDEDNYPTSSNTVVNDIKHDETQTFVTTYTYVK